MKQKGIGKMSGHSNWPEWIYVAVVIALMCYVGAEHNLPVVATNEVLCWCRSLEC